MTFKLKQRPEPVAAAAPAQPEPRPAERVPAFRRLVVFGSLDATAPGPRLRAA